MGVNEQEAEHFQFYTSEVKKLRSELLQERERYSALLSMNSDCLFEYDISSDILIFSKNNVFSRLDGLILHEFSKKIEQFTCIHEEDRESLRQLLKSTQDCRMEFRYIGEDGQELWCSAKGVMICDEENKVRFVTGCIQNIDKEKRERERLIEEAKRDPLTKLYNKGYTRSEIEHFIEGEGKDGTHALMIADIDNFKRINDCMGHLFGDTVLTGIADNLMQIFYDTDIVGRIGGDEFLILLKNTNDTDVLRKKASQILKAFRDTYTGEREELGVSCSMGVALYPKDGTKFEELFEKADTALYDTKEKGKGYCSFYDPADMGGRFQKSRESYSHYSIKEPPQNSVSLDTDITGFAFDIMARTTDVNSAMKLLTDRMGKRFHASYVCIMERNGNGSALKSTYLWNEQEGICEKKSFSDMEDRLLLLKAFSFDNRGLCIINDIEKLKGSQTELKNVLQDMGIASLLACAFYEEGLLKGCICIADGRRARAWTKEERDSLYTVTRIVSFYLSKLRVSERIQEKLDILTNYDSLTGLPGMNKFREDAKDLVSANPDKKYAIVYLDIENFKYINDTWGYDTGDRILCSLAGFLQGKLEEGELTARGYADNFIMLMEIADTGTLRERVLEFSREFGRHRLGGLNQNLIIVSGICEIQSGGSNLTAAIDNANTARKSCKKSSSPACRIYDKEMEDRIRREADLTNSMEVALENGEFVVYLQPKIGLRGSRLVGAEALVRWKRPDGTMLPPNDFIPLFEKNGFIVKLDDYVYEEVCKMLNKWLKAGMPVVTVSFNVSRVHLNDRRFVSRIQKLADQYEIPYHLLELEMTEGIFLDNPQTAISIMKELRNMGFGVSIDDFGAGYSSLNLLKDMTTDVLKLDKEFFRQGEMQIEEQIIVSSIISMAKKLNMKVLSEGVETKMQSDFLKNVDCDMVQGYLYEKPMPIQAFEGLLARRDQTIEPKNE